MRLAFPDGVEPDEDVIQAVRFDYRLVGPVDGRQVVAPSLVPAKEEGGHCHWFRDGRCLVHANSPFGCAFLDQHLSDREALRRNNEGRLARAEAFRSSSLYARVWHHLREKGLTYLSGPADRAAAMAAIRRLDRQAERRQVREKRKRKRSGQ